MAALRLEREVKDPAWYFDVDEPDFEGPAVEVAALISKTMLRCGEDLARYSDDQVGQGLNYIFNNACSNIIFSLSNPEAPFEARMNAVRSIKSLYKDCFTPRCTPSLGHKSEPAASEPINFICYMFWDVSPIHYWEKKERKEESYAVVLEVLADALTSQNMACVESALHGLGHVHQYAPGAAEIVQSFLRNPHITDERLLAYAERAAVGYVL